MSKGLLKLLFLFLLAPGVSAAETVYVHDQLRLGVRAEPNSSDNPITVVTTGDALTVLGEDGSYLNVRTGAGVEGWVSRSYVSAEPPARARLEMLQQQYGKLKKELDELRTMLAETQEREEQAQKQLADVMSDNASMHQQLSRYYSSNAELKRKYSWLYEAAAMFALFAAGIWFGIRWYKRRIAERIGGLEI